MAQKQCTKHRTYQCPGCGVWCFRPLAPDPHPCMRCGHSLDGLEYKIDDVMVAVRCKFYEGAPLESE